MLPHNVIFTDDAASTKRAATQLEDLRDSLVELHGALKRGSCEVSFEIVLILMSRTSCPEDSQAGIKQLFSQKDSPFHLISSEKADKIQVPDCFLIEIQAIHYNFRISKILFEMFFKTFHYFSIQFLKIKKYKK